MGTGLVRHSMQKEARGSPAALSAPNEQQEAMLVQFTHRDLYKPGPICPMSAQQRESTSALLTSAAVLSLPSKPPLVQNSTAGSLAPVAKGSCGSKCTCAITPHSDVAELALHPRLAQCGGERQCCPLQLLCWI